MKEKVKKYIGIAKENLLKQKFDNYDMVFIIL